MTISSSPPTALPACRRSRSSRAAFRDAAARPPSARPSVRGQSAQGPPQHWQQAQSGPPPPLSRELAFAAFASTPGRVGLRTAAAALGPSLPCRRRAVYWRRRRHSPPTLHAARRDAPSRGGAPPYYPALPLPPPGSRSHHEAATCTPTAPCLGPAMRLAPPLHPDLPLAARPSCMAPGGASGRGDGGTPGEPWGVG